FRIADTAKRPYGQLQASFGLGFLHLRRGEFTRAIPVLERALEICRISNLRALAFHGVAAFLGGSYAWSGRVGDAIALLDPVVAQTAPMGAGVDHLIAPRPARPPRPRDRGQRASPGGGAGRSRGRGRAGGGMRARRGATRLRSRMR